MQNSNQIISFHINTQFNTSNMPMPLVLINYILSLESLEGGWLFLIGIQVR